MTKPADKDVSEHLWKIIDALREEIKLLRHEKGELLFTMRIYARDEDYPIPNSGLAARRAIESYGK